MPSISEQLSRFAHDISARDIPEPVKRRAKHLILDGAGIALASSTYDFAHRTVNALGAFGGGDARVIGFPTQLALRDAVVANGVLIHGLDFDDTHQVGTIHATASCFPTSLGVTASTGMSGEDLLTGYVLGMEVGARVGAVAKGELVQQGFHPTGVVAAFACSLIAGRLYGLTPEQLTMAQGIVLSMASGAREYSSDASGTKRLHPGWAGLCGISAAVLARGGFTGPRTAYEGKFGFYATHLKGEPDLPAATRDLGSKWEIEEVAIKPFPVGHLNIAFIDAAIALSRKHPMKAAEIESIEVLVPPHAVKVVCEPVAQRKRPANSYAAQFSIQYAVACGLLRQRFGLVELEQYQDAELLSVADKVSYRLDPNTGYPRSWSGEVIVTLKNGKKVSHREQHNRGAVDNPVSEAGIVEKFMGNATVAVSHRRALDIRDAILTLESMDDAGELAELLAAR